MGNLAEIERFVSICLMKQDCDTIFSLLQTEHDPIFAMEVVPYYALFIQSCQEFIGQNLLIDTLTNELKDIRNHIKSYSDGFGRSKKKVLKIDNGQNSDYKEKLCFDFLKNYDIHYNFGSYWTEDKHIIGNTYQLAEFLSVKSMFDPNLNDRFYQVGYQIGSFVSSFREGLSENIKENEIERNKTSISIKYYYDINTNKQNCIFNRGLSKELNLFFINLLCNMNFVKHILNKLFVDGNTWLFRVEYIVTYYTFRSLERLKNYSDNNKDISIEMNEISTIIIQGKSMFNSKMRNCMMHYNLEGANVISLENIDNELHGIVESCFDGINYKEYLKKLHQYSDTVINYLENQFDFSEVRMEEL